VIAQVSDEPLETRTVDRLRVQIYRGRPAMGIAAAQDVATEMRRVLDRTSTVRMVFAAAPSQSEFLHALSQAADLDWSRVTVFQMDEYLGLPRDAPQSFGRFLRDNLFEHVRPGIIHLIDGGKSASAEAERYADLLAVAPIDIVCLGIGENGHLAFNDPPDAHFDDPAAVKAVALVLASRQQQVNDGCFPFLDSVPTHALTLTIPTLMSGRSLFGVVPGQTKAEAVRNTLSGTISPACPASILRRHANCTLYLDVASSGLLNSDPGLVS
jgi:glucosamine-6-phosphate deaminase